MLRKTKYMREGNSMEGRIVFIQHEKGYGRINTQNKEIGFLTFYLSSLKTKVKTGDTVSFEIKKSKTTGKKYAVNVCPVFRNDSKFNTEDKQVWCKEGERLENEFIKKAVPLLGIDLRINPEKEKNACAIDLVDYTNHRFADVKSQSTPFFTAANYDYKYLNQIMKYDPTYTVTFNKKDYENYKVRYPECDIYFWIEWQQTKYSNITVENLSGVWRAKFVDMAKKIENCEVYIHQYMHRKDDDVNAKESYLFALNDDTVFKRLL